MHPMSRLELRRIANARAAARRISRKAGGKLQPKEPVFYGRTRREERRYFAAMAAEEREFELSMLAQADAWACRHVRWNRRLRKLELSPRRMKALHRKLEAGAPRTLLGRAELRLAYHYEVQQCMEYDALMLRNCY